MKTYTEWRLGGSDPEWEKLKSEWGGGSKSVNANLVSKMRLKVEGIKDSFARDLGDKKIQSFRDVPPGMRDELAKAIIVATLKSFYGDMGISTGPVKEQPKQPPKPQQPAPTEQPEPNAPAGWKG